MKIRTSLLALLCAVGLCLGTAPVCSAADKGPIKIGVFLPLTGQNAFGGQLELDGVRLAHQEMPKVLDREVELVVVDNKSDKVESGNAVKRLIERDHVSAIIGSYGSSLAMAGGEVAEKGKTPVVGTSCTNPLVTMGKKYYFRVCYIDPWQGSAAATYVFNNLKMKKAAVLMDMTNDYAVGLASFFERSFKKLGGEVVAKLKYSSGDQDFTAQLTELIRLKPDVVFMPAYFAEGAIIMKQARELGAKFRLMGADAMDNPDTVKLGGKAVEAPSPMMPRCPTCPLKPRSSRKCGTRPIPTRIPTSTLPWATMPITSLWTPSSVPVLPISRPSPMPWPRPRAWPHLWASSPSMPPMTPKCLWALSNTATASASI